jgi:hypothetical protein
VLPAGQAAERELAAQAELAVLGALPVMNAGWEHVLSVHLSMLYSPHALDRPVELLLALPRLQSLLADGTPMRDGHAPELARLAGLQDLVLSRTAITDAARDQLQNLSQPTTIYLADSAVTSASLRRLGR